MQVYLPIAEMSVNALAIVGMGWVAGVLSGLFGVGGGFLLTPFLIFIGVPPAVAVGTQANQLIGASVSGVLAHWRRGAVDVKMGLMMLAGSALGGGLGVALFGVLQRLGQIDLVISLGKNTVDTSTRAPSARSGGGAKPLPQITPPSQGERRSPAAGERVLVEVAS